MSGAFCVYGISRSLCRKMAAKRVPETYYVTDTADVTKKRLVALTPPQWGEEVNKEGDKDFETATKRVKISPELDTPQFCRDWITAQPADVKNAVVMARVPKTDKLGAVVMKLGAVVMTWAEYDESKQWARPFGEAE